MPEGPDLQIQKLVKKFEEMGITVNLNIRLYELDVNSRVKYLNKIRWLSNNYICAKGYDNINDFCEAYV